MHQMEVDVQQRGRARLLDDDVRVPDLVEEGSRRHEAEAAPAGASMRCGWSRGSCPLMVASRFSACTYALAAATRMSVSAPCPDASVPSRRRRTLTSPTASIPPV